MFSFLVPLSAQIEFAPIGATYYYLQETQFGPDNPLTPSVPSTTVIGDTIIQGQACRVLFGAGMNWLCNTSEEGEIFMYEESKKVYYFHHGTQTFDLLYDFSKNAGEYWEVPAFCYSGPGCGFDQNFTVMVDSVSQIDLNGLAVKVQHVTLFNAEGNINYANIYEGIGDIDHMFFEESWHCTTAHDWIRGLRCYDSPVDGVFSFFDDEGTCGMVVDTDEINDKELFVHVFPNPSSEKIRVSITGYFDWFLYNLQGERLEWKTDNINEDEIALERFQKGIYFLKIKQGDKVKVEKIIKQ